MNVNGKNNHWCPYYDRGLFIGATPSGQNMISMCPWQKTQVVDRVSFDHPYLESLRTQSKNFIPKECSRYCNIPNHVANERERSQQESWCNESQQVIKKLHIEQSLACNLACISCSTKFSSGWNRHYSHFDPDAPLVRLKSRVKSVWEDLDLRHVESLHFTGGEPLMNPQNLEILEHLDSLGRLDHVTATYNTNGTIRINERWFNLWKKMKWVRLHFSLDGIGSTFEYTRYPAKWAEVEDNIRWYRHLEGPCILIEVNAIVGIHNIFNLLDFYEWFKAHCQTGNQGDTSRIFVRGIEGHSHGGRVLHLRHLPEEYKESAQRILKEISDLDGALGLIADISTDPSLGWLDYLEKLDHLRKLSWKSMLPAPLTNYIRPL